MMDAYLRQYYVLCTPLHSKQNSVPKETEAH